MSKNMTRKGLAFGAGLALVASGLAVAPASAAVDDNLVSLVPFTGTQYSMVTDGYFDLKSTQSTSAASSTGKISYKVTDPNSISKFDYAADLAANTTAETLAAAVNFNDDTGLSVAYVASTDVVTVTATGASGTLFAGMAAGDIIQVTGLNSTNITTAFTGLAEVISNTTNDVLTFKLPTLATTSSGDVSTEAVSAGTFVEVSDNVELDSYEIISAGALGGGVTTLTAPTRASNGSYVVVGPDADSTKTDLLRLVASKAGSVTVQAWIDENADGLIDSTEATSSARTVTFVTWANSGAALNIETPVAGADWEVYVSFNSTINASQIPATRLDVALGVLDAGVLEKAVTNTTVTTGAFTAATDSLVWDDATNHVDNYWGLKAQVDSNLAGVAKTDFVAGYTYAGQIFLDGEAYGNITYTNIGDAVADKLGAIKATRGDNVRQNGTTVTVKEDYTGSVEFKLLLTENDATIASDALTGVAGDIPVAAGTAATVKIAKGSLLDADSTIASGGKTLTNVSDPAYITYTAVADANGYVTFSLTNDEAEVGDDLNITVTHSGTAVTADVTWAAPTATNSVLSGATVLSALAKGTWSNTYTAVDDFGAPLAGPTYRLSVTYYDKVGGTQKTTGVALNASGQGTLTVTDKSTAVGNFSVVATLQKLNTSAVYANFGDPEQVTSTVFVVSNMTPAAVTIVETITTADNTGDPKTEPVAAVNADATAPNGDTAPAVSAAEKTTISGVVTSSSGSAVRGTSVVVSAPGLFFKSGDVYTVGSATVVTDNVGAYTVEVRSNFAGEQLVTVTAGSATKTKSIGFDAVAETVGTSLVIDAPTSAAPGSSYTVTVSLKDAFGNPVKTTTADKFTLSYKGAGIALSVPSDTDSNGEASFAVLLGSNDTAVGTITATYNADSDKTTVDNNLTTVATVNGAAASADQKVNAGSFKGYVALYAKGYAGQRMSAKVGNDWVVVPVLASNFERVVEFTGAGYTVAVRIYIDRVLIDTITVTTK